MSESVETPVLETPVAAARRFNVRRAVKAAAITTGVVAGVVLLKRKLNTDVSGEVTATVATNDQG